MAGILGPIIGAAGSLLGGIFGSFGTASAAKKQLQAVRETNEANLNLAREQNVWNEMMWNKTNEYNSASAQVQRLLDAGLNPNLVNDAGQSSPLTSANLSNQQAPDYSLHAKIGDQINNTISNVIEGLRVKADVEKTKADIAESQTRVDIAKGLFPYQRDYQSALARNELAQAGLSEKNLQYFDVNQRWTLMQLMANVKKTETEERKIQADVDYQVRSNKFIERLNEAQLRKLNSAVRSDNAIAALNETINSFRSRGIGVSNHWITDLVGLAISNPDELSNSIDNLVSGAKGVDKAVRKHLKEHLNSKTPDFIKKYFPDFGFGNWIKDSY